MQMLYRHCVNALKACENLKVAIVGAKQKSGRIAVASGRQVFLTKPWPDKKLFHLTLTGGSETYWVTPDEHGYLLEGIEYIEYDFPNMVRGASAILRQGQPVPPSGRYYGLYTGLTGLKAVHVFKKVGLPNEDLCFQNFVHPNYTAPLFTQGAFPDLKVWWDKCRARQIRDITREIKAPINQIAHGPTTIEIPRVNSNWTGCTQHTTFTTS